MARLCGDELEPPLIVQIGDPRIRVWIRALGNGRCVVDGVVLRDQHEGTERETSRRAGRIGDGDADERRCQNADDVRCVACAYRHGGPPNSTVPKRLFIARRDRLQPAWSSIDLYRQGSGLEALTASGEQRQSMPETT